MPRSESGAAHSPAPDAPAESERADVLLFPYLLVRERAEIGAWELIPKAAFTDADAREQWIADSVRGLFALYEAIADTQHGAVLRPAQGIVGDPFEREAMTPLHRAVVTAALDRNPEVTGPPRQPGHSVATSDNALLYGHGIEPEGWVAVQYGLLMQTTVAGLQIGGDQGVIHSPPELHLAIAGSTLDGDYLAALWQIVTADSVVARRVGRAIDWLDLSWRNTTSITHEMRILTLKAGFEVLFDSDDVVVLRERLSALLEPAEAERTIRRWNTRAGNERSADLTDLEWWFTQFTFLRNAIAHGDSIAEERFEHEGRDHMWIAESTLRKAIKHKVAELAEEPDILLEPLDRAARRAIRALEAKTDEELRLGGS